VVKRLDPTPPAPGKDYVFAWDSTNEAGERVPDGRYVLRVGARTESPQGTARSELRYWIDVPIEKTQRRLALLSPMGLQSLQAQLMEAKPGSLVFAYLAPKDGHLTVSAIDTEGRVVRHVLDEQVVNGWHKLSWDGADDQGKPLPDGTYTVIFELDSGEAGAWWGLVVVETGTEG